MTKLIGPDEGGRIPRLQVPGDFYWVLTSPAPLAGMRLPRSSWPWSDIASAGFSKVVGLHPASYDPAPLSLVVKVDLEAFGHQLRHRSENIEACFIEGLPHMSGKDAELTADLTISGKGKLLRFQKDSANFGSAEVEICVQRQLRATQFPLLGGDYGVVDDYTFRVQIPD